MEDSLAKTLLRTKEKLKSDRGSFNALLDEASRFVRPSMQRNKARGANRRVDILNTIAEDSNESFASGVQSLLFSSVAKNFSITSTDDNVMRDYNNRLWFDIVTDRMHAQLSSDVSGFTGELNSTMLDLGIGTGILYSDENINRKSMRFKSYSTRQCFYRSNEDGEVNELYREFTATPIDAIRLFGEDKLPQELKDMAEDNNKRHKIQNFVHAVTPNYNQIVGKINHEGKPFKSYYIWQDKTLIISVGGYDEFPYHVARWTKYSGEEEGRGPAIKALNTIRLVNRIDSTLITSSELSTLPPLQVPDDSFLGKIKLNPLAINYRRGGLSRDDRIERIDIGGNVNVGEVLLKQKEEIIRRAFYYDLFQLPQDLPQMTATETIQRRDDRMGIIAPMIGRLETDFKGKIVRRLFNIMLKGGYFPPMPDSIKGSNVEITYHSPVETAQKASKAARLQQFEQDVALTAQFSPEVVDIINADELIKYKSELRDIPVSVLRSDEDVINLRRSRNEQQQQQQTLDQANQLADGLGTLAKAQRDSQVLQ